MTSDKYNIASLKKIRDRSNQWLTERTERLAAKLGRIMIACNGYNKIQPIRLSKSAATMGHATNKPDADVLPAREASVKTHNTCQYRRGRSDMACLDTGEQHQFRPCLGSGHHNRQPQLSVMNKYEVRPVPLTNRPSYGHSGHPVIMRQPPTLPTTADSMHWGADISQMPPRCTTPAPLLAVRRNPHTLHQRALASPAPRHITQLTTIIAQRPTGAQHQDQTPDRSASTVVNGKCERHRRADCAAMVAQINRACALGESRILTKAHGCRRQRQQLVRQRTAPAKLR